MTLLDTPSRATLQCVLVGFTLLNSRVFIEFLFVITSGPFSLRPSAEHTVEAPLMHSVLMNVCDGPGKLGVEAEGRDKK